jgi:hypothetical protein
MRRTRCIFQACAAVVAAAVISNVASAALVITEVMAQTTAGTPSTVSDDWWELTNSGPLAVNLLGYQWADTEDALPSTDSNFFPSFVINPGQSIIISGELAAAEAQWRTMWNVPASVEILSQDEMVDDSTPDGDTFSGLGSSNDAVFFYDPAGNQLSGYAYGANTRGVSFEATNWGADLGGSVINENGAFQASNNDIGSPGFAVGVPEPSTIAMVALAGLALVYRRVR